MRTAVTVTYETKLGTQFTRTYHIRSENRSQALAIAERMVKGQGHTLRLMTTARSTAK